ncbi:hypothetical protein MC885_002180 [Smutsia gigantea]|nr:hypothetical protein MC885_002180 [Smutsia gigantea]
MLKSGLSGMKTHSQVLRLKERMGMWQHNKMLWYSWNLTILRT